MYSIESCTQVRHVWDPRTNLVVVWVDRDQVLMELVRNKGRKWWRDVRALLHHADS